MTKKIAFLFPGQGAQSVGMGKDLYEAFPSVQEIYQRADSILGYPLSKITFEGPEEALTRTCYAQPAIFVLSYCALHLLLVQLPKLRPSLTAGLSLGEFTALVACGSLSFEDGLNLVRRRAEAMERSAKLHPGTMASILGLSEKDCQEIAAAAGCEVANLNSPDQIALSGSIASIEEACRLAEAKGAKRAIPLKVGGAFHSSLMREAKDELSEALQQTTIKSPECLFIPNVTGKPESDPARIRDLLSKQLMSPVRWSDSMQFIPQLEIHYGIEIGPGKVLKGLARKSTSNLEIDNLGTVPDFQKLEIKIREGSLC